MAAGSLPSRRYNRAWLTQRILNRIPEWTRARRSPVSIAQQLTNVFANEIQDTTQALSHERANSILASCDLSLPDHSWRVDLPARFEFSFTENTDQQISYTAPKVYGEIDGTYTSITQAEDNNLQTFFYESLPTRIQYDERQTLWDYVVPETKISDFSSVVPGPLPIEGPLYVTLKNNTVWEEEFRGIVYRSKIHLKGTDLLGEEIEEVFPLRMNCTYKTRNSWKTLDEVFVLYLSDSATISIASLPFDEEEILNSRNVAIDNNGIEQYQFYMLEEKSFGSVLTGKRFLAGSLDQVRMGLSSKTTNLEIELLDEEGVNIHANAIAFWPWTNYMYVVDDNYLYIYDYSVPFPDVQNMRNDTGDNRMSIVFQDNKWIYTRDDSAYFYTRISDLASIPISNRWTITYPDGSQYRLGLDGSLWPSSVGGWITNADYEDEGWKEQKIPFSSFTQTGSYVIEFEGKYMEEDGTVSYKTTKELVSVPAIVPETQILLPVELRNPRNIGVDEEGSLWFYNGTSLLLSAIYYDYFMVDYNKKTVWLREQYPLVRITP